MARVPQKDQSFPVLVSRASARCLTFSLALRYPPPAPDPLEGRQAVPAAVNLACSGERRLGAGPWGLGEAAAAPGSVRLVCTRPPRSVHCFRLGWDLQKAPCVDLRYEVGPAVTTNSSLSLGAVCSYLSV